jgi:hypothetical protein
MSLGSLITSTVKCTICGAGYGQCDCWRKCPKCGWSIQKGHECRSPTCGGTDNGHQIVAMSKPKRRKTPRALSKQGEGS